MFWGPRVMPTVLGSPEPLASVLEKSCLGISCILFELGTPNLVGEYILGLQFSDHCDLDLWP